MRLGALILSALLPVAAGAAEPLNGWFASLQTHVSIFSVAQDKSLLASQFGYGVNGGYRWDSWGLYLHVEHNMWQATATEGTEIVTGVVNLGVGGEYVFADGLIRSGLAIGPSILAFGAALDDPGETGIFLDVRTLGLRFDVHDHVVVGLDPLTFALVMPVLGGIPIIEVQYRTSLYVEGLF